MSKCDGAITYVEDRTVEYGAEVTEDGNIICIRMPHGPDVLDVHDSSLWCSTCGRLGSDEFAAHGLVNDWEVV